MKKLLILLLFVFVLTGCNNSLKLDFNDNVDATIELSFNKDDYIKNVSSIGNETNFKYAIEDIIVESRPIKNNYDEMFKGNINITNSECEGEYKYTYTYETFKNNAIFDRCFEYSDIIEENDKYIIYLKGKSSCGEFEFRVKADNRMLNNNSNKSKNGEYIWKVSNDKNDIQFDISKDVIKNTGISLGNIISIIITIGLGGLAFFIYKKNKN